MSLSETQASFDNKAPKDSFSTANYTLSHFLCRCLPGQYGYMSQKCFLPPEPLIGSSAVMSCGNTTRSSRGAEGAEVIHVLVWRNTLVQRSIKPSHLSIGLSFQEVIGGR